MNNIDQYLNVVNALNRTADMFMAAEIYFNEHAGPGHAACCRKEAKELWYLVNRIRSHISHRGGKTPQYTSQPAIKLDWKFNQVIPTLKAKQEETASVISAAVKALQMGQDFIGAHFMSGIACEHFKELYEIRVLTTHMQGENKTAADHDRWLLEEYSHKCDHNQCGKYNLAFP